MKKPLLIQSHFFSLFLSLLAAAVSSEVGAQYWMQKGGGLTVDEAYDIATDGDGNSYTTGYFTGSATFGSTTLSSEGNTDIFVVKTNDQGAVQWAVSAGGSGSDRGHSIDCDADGNCVVTGYFNGTATWDTASRTSDGLQDIFIAKYNSSGDLQWVLRAGGSDSDVGNGISLDNSGNAVATGEFKGTADFGSATVTSGGNSDVFITKVSSSGSFVWTEKGSGVNADRGLDIACDNSGNSYGIGQFSGNITFDNTLSNTMFNVIYVVKFNSSGAEQWIRLIGAGTSNIGNSIASDGSGNIYLTGDFTGTVTFFGSTNTNLSGTYSNGVFIAKYSSAGALSWATSASSDSHLSSKSIALDGSGNAYIVGTFACRLDEFSDEYGEAIFNSVGYKDIYMAKYTSGGSFSYARHAGGRKDDFAFGAATAGADLLHFAGSFEGSLNFPVSDNFASTNLSAWNNISCSDNNNYCGDPDYGTFYRYNSAGNLDAAFANCFDPDRQPYDYYQRSGSGCVRDIIPNCIEAGCPDTVEFCQAAVLSGISNTCGNAGPDYTTANMQQWNWSSGWDEQTGALYTSTGYKWVDLTTIDDCFTNRDSIYVIVNPNPVVHISDDVVVGTEETSSYIIDLCGADTVTLTAGGYGANSILWTGPGLGAGSTSPVITTTLQGVFNVQVTDPATGCTYSNSVEIIHHDTLPNFLFKFEVGDTAHFCEGEPLYVWLYDSIANPNAIHICFPYSNFSTTASVNPTDTMEVFCETRVGLLNPDTGWHTLTAQIIINNPCESDTFDVTATFYIAASPSPTVNPFTIQIAGSNYYCPGGQSVQVANGAPGQIWSTPNSYNGSTNDTIYAGVAGWYTVSWTVNDTNEYGCTAQHYSEFIKYIQQKPQPDLSASAYIICPNDSVLLTLTSTGGSTGYFWEGPSGPIFSNTPNIYVTEAGAYSCTFNDADSCELVSNTVVLQQYTTPQLAAMGDLILCEGDSVTINVIADSSSEVLWLPPLNDSGLSVTVYAPGTYSAQITSCGITTTASIDVLPSEVDATVSVSGVLCANDTMVLHAVPGQFNYNWIPGGSSADSLIVSQEGYYQLIATDSSGCSKISDSVFVPMVQKPTIVSMDTIPVFCVGDSVVLYGNDSMVSYHWSPTDDTTRYITVFAPGFYSLTTTDTFGCVGADTSLKLINPRTDAPVSIVGDTSFCEGDSVIFQATRKGGIAVHYWLSDSIDTNVLVVTESGKYQLLSIDTFGCISTSQVVKTYMQPNLLDKPNGRDTTICIGTSATLRADANLGDLSWYDETNKQPVFIGNEFITGPLFDTVTYTIYSALSLCISDTAAITVTVKDCDNAFVPNFLTPNGDGLNDVFRLTLAEIDCYEMQIFNRWGVLVFASLIYGNGWDGTLTQTGELASEGIYYYVVDVCKHDGSNERIVGDVTLIR